MDIDYVSQYLSINFDNMILNDLVHSEEFYLQYKRKYLQQTESNYKQFNIYVDELNKLTDIQSSVSGTKYKYVYVDTNRLEYLKQQIKNIVISQNILLDNFNNHIILLNTNPEKFQNISEKPTRKTFLNTLKLFKKRNEK